MHLVGLSRNCVSTGKGIELPQSETAVRIAGEDQVKATISALA